MVLFHFYGTVFKAVSLFSQLWQKQLKGERICFGSQFVGGGEGTVLGCERLTLHPESGGRDGRWCSARFLPHLRGLQSMEWHHPQWVDLLTLVNSITAMPRGLSASWVTLDPVKVTILIIIQTKQQLIDRVLSLSRSKPLHQDGHGTEPDIILGEGQMSKNLNSHRADSAFPCILPKGECG